MKHIFLQFLLMMTSGTFLFAQPPGQRPHGEEGEKKIKALYVAFITEELSLTEDESQKFWPIHAQFDLDMREVHKKKQSELEKEEDLLNTKKKYREKFQKVLGNDRTDLFFKKDRAFRDKMFERIRMRRMQRGNKAKSEKSFN